LCSFLCFFLRFRSFSDSDEDEDELESEEDDDTDEDLSLFRLLCESSSRPRLSSVSIFRFRSAEDEVWDDDILSLSKEETQKTKTNQTPTHILPKLFFLVIFFHGGCLVPSWGLCGQGGKKGTRNASDVGQETLLVAFLHIEPGQLLLALSLDERLQ